MNPFEQLQTDMNLFERTSEDLDVAVEALAHSSPIEPEKPPAGSCSECSKVVYRAQVSTSTGPRFFSFDRTLAGLGNHDIRKQTTGSHSWERWAAFARKWGDYRLHLCLGEPEMNWSPEAKAAIEAPAGPVPLMTGFVGSIDPDGGWEAESYFGGAA